MGTDEIRQQVYLTLADLLKQPDEVMVHNLIEGTVIDFMAEAANQLNYYIQIPASLQQDNTKQLALATLTRDWAESIGPFKGTCKPIESLYKQWTLDESCQLPLAKQKGWLGSDWAWHMKQLLEDFGLELPQQFTSYPDHLILQLELMAILIEHGHMAVQEQFMHQHLDWLEELWQNSKEQKISRFYSDLLFLCKEIIAADKSHVNKVLN